MSLRAGNSRGLRAAAMAFGLMAAQAGAEAPAQTLRIGVTSGPQAEIMELVKHIAAGKGLDLRIVRYEDGRQLDADLAAGALDANSFQDLEYLQAQNQAHGYQLVDVAYTVTLPLAFYSKRLASLRELKPGDRVALPSTPADCARALILLQNYGLITFPDAAGLHATPRDISANPRKLRFLSLAPDQLPAALPKVAFAAMPWSVAEQAGLQPARDSIGMEDARSPYADVIAVRAQDKNQPWVAGLVAAYHSEPIKHFILTRYQDSVRRPW